MQTFLQDVLALQVPIMTVNDDASEVTPVKAGDAESTTPFELLCTPLCLTSGIYQGRRIVDLTHDEQQMVSSTVAVVARDADTLLGALPGRTTQ
jgi:hypothetical protein